MWKYIHIDTREEMIMSGWKLYIHGNSLAESLLLEELLLPVVREYNLTTKIALDDIILRNRYRNIAWSSMVVYLPNIGVINMREFLDCLSYKLNSYSSVDTIRGALRIRDNISIRYDLSIPIEASVGVQYEEYLKYYRGEYGPFNIKHNQLIIS